ncbi:MAG: sigma 54-interacting transcriptional regulator, partial [Desulfovibrionales bacterium]|nr:sigma 54-interacting transcriptional regulator [Desulfovibrionales bacterium]
FLRVLQEHRFRPVGARTEKTSDFRLICATNRDLDAMVARGTFRSDLLFRIRTVVMALPPLRDRADDLPRLIDHYVKQLCGKYGMPAKGISPDLLDVAQAYSWPGNVRELIHTLERAVLAAKDTPKIFSRHLPDHIRINIARAAAGKYLQQEAPVPLHNGAFCDLPDADQLSETSRSDALPHVPENHPTSLPDHSGMATEEEGTLPPLTVQSTPVAPSSVHPAEAHKEAPAAHSATPRFSPEGQHTMPNSEITDTTRTESSIADRPDNQLSITPFFTFRDHVFTQYLEELMIKSNGNVARACELSGLSRSYLYDLLKKYAVKK